MPDKSEQQTTTKPAAKRAIVKKPVVRRAAAAKPGVAKKTTANAVVTKKTAPKTKAKPAAKEAPVTAPLSATKNTSTKPSLSEAAGKLREMIQSGLLSKDTLVTAATIAKAMTNPKVFSQHQQQLLKELTSVVGGKSEISPTKGDRRFNDETWTKNPFYKSLMQSYLTLNKGVDQWLLNTDLETQQLERSRIVFSNAMDALSPTNTLLGNPAALKKAFDTSGISLVEGAKNYVNDMLNNGGMPASVDTKPFTLGESVACTKGKVVFRNEMMELLQYQPQTETVHKRPLFFTPPQINKYYFYDLAPQRSMIEYALQQGFQVFVVSWYNPTAEQSHWGFEDYVKSLSQGVEITCEIAGSDSANVLGACSGGITATTMVAYLAAKNSKRVNSLTLMVAVLDSGQNKDTPLGLFANRQVLELAMLLSGNKGILEGKELSKIFAWMRPNDLVWNYWVNNYLMGNQPASFDILAWNSDTTNLPAKLHHDFINLLKQNPLKQDGSMTIDGVPINLKKVVQDTFIVGGSTDHITPWEACYQTRHMLDSNSEFVLSASGHIQALVNPPGNPRARYQTCSVPHSTPEQFLEHAQEHTGTWWQYWSPWLADRSGERVKAPTNMGNKQHQPLCDAPGTYVLAKN